MAKKKKPIYGFGLGTSYDCPDEHRTKDLLGGKGWGLAEMSSMGLPVPEGVTITTACHAKYRKASDEDRKAMLDKLAEDALKMIKDHTEGPLLLSARSGAPVSMPGMMDTILNIGMNRANVDEYAEYLGEWAAADSYRRLIQMMGSTAYGIKAQVFENHIKQVKIDEGQPDADDADLTLAQMMKLVDLFEESFKSITGLPFPQDIVAQLKVSIGTVFESWDLDRAKHYRKMNKIPESMGTAVNVQSMVFGNRNNKSGSGVFFTRDANTGAKVLYGEFLVNAQGEDVVAGVRTPISIDEMLEGPDDMWNDIYNQIAEVSEKLEGYYQDMVDCEFTVEDGVFYMLQSRVGKRTAPAAVKIAVDLIDEKMITPDVISDYVNAEQYTSCMIDRVDPKFETPPDGTGIAASSGAITGVIALSSASAINCTEDCILVTHETTPDDIAGMEAAKAILTQTGGTTSHAAVVARSMDRPCVVGLTDITFQGEMVVLNGKGFNEGDKITIDGATGKVWFHGSEYEVPVVSMKDSDVVKKFESIVLSQTDHYVLAGPEDLAEGYSAKFWWTPLAFDSCDHMVEAFSQNGRPGDMLDFRASVNHHNTEDSYLWDHVMAEAFPHELWEKAPLPPADLCKGTSIQGGSWVPKPFLLHLTENGAKGMGEAQNLEELINGVGSYMEPDTVKIVFGSQETMDTVLKKLNVEVFSGATGPLSKQGAVLMELGPKE